MKKDNNNILEGLMVIRGISSDCDEVINVI